jgi:hypothetical protein
LKAVGLKKMDLYSNTDGFAVLFQKNAAGQWVKLANTNVVEDNQNPECNYRLHTAICIFSIQFDSSYILFRDHMFPDHVPL